MTYGAVKVYDKKTGKYIGLACWTRPTDEITPEERRKREAAFNRQVFKMATANPNPKPREERSYTENVEITPELKALINKSLETGRADPEEFTRAVQGN